ncbi:MAG: SusC/RagA family TonB-linked outer membrane protein [Bacteroidales bacterium]
MKKQLLIFLLMLTSFAMYAQNKQIKGIVFDTQNEPIIGASVVEDGTTNGTVTDLDGNFQLTVKPNSKLKVTYVGYVPAIVNVGNNVSLTIVLKEDSEQLEEVVITGYGGKQLRTKTTNSIAKVKEEVFANGVFSNPAQALSGAVAGLRVVQSSGNPGAAPAIVLRGGTNLNGSGSPLILVDGQFRESLSDINPEDIESMEVMKDAGATAIYGARANNGVILITTKRGKAGISEINVKAKVGWNYLTNPYDFMDGRDYLYWMRKAYQNSAQMFKKGDGSWVGITNLNTLDGATAYGTGNLYWADANKTIPLDGNKDNRAVWSPMNYTPDLAFLLNQGWETMIDPVYGKEIIFRNWDMGKNNINSPAMTQDYNISFTGGNEKGSYYAGLGYNHTEGLPLDNYYQRISFTINADYKIREWLTSYSNFAFADAKWRGLPPTQGDEANYFSRMLSAPPTLRGYNANGDLLLGVNSGDGNQGVNINQFTRKNNTDKFTLGQSFRIDLMKSLSLKVSGTWYYDEGYYESFNKDYLASPGNVNTSRNSSAEFQRTLNQTYNAVLNYDQTFNKNHQISALAGIEYYDKYISGFNASGSGAPTDDFGDLGLTSKDKDKRNIDSWHQRERIFSGFARVNYDFMNKYLLSAVVREDGYSRLLGSNRWGVFPGVSAGWLIGNESFMSGTKDVISFAKIRSSFGLNGNVSDIGPYELQGSYGTNRYNGGIGYLLNNVPNPYLRWEKSHTFEVGADISFLENKINANFTYYDRLTKGKYANIQLPASSGLSSIRTNNGEIQNRGVEIELGFKILTTKDWVWNVNANIAYNKNIIKKLPNNGLERNRQSAFQVYNPKTKELMWVGGYQEGQEPGQIYGFKYEGVYKSYDEIPGGLVDKTSGNNGSNGLVLYGPDAWAKLPESQKIKSNGFAAALPIQPGDAKWKDVNGDGVIDNYDMVKIGNSTPRWTGGITSMLKWKDLTFNARFDYGLGFTVVDWRTPWIMGNMQGTFNSLVDSKDTWTPENPNAKYPTYVWADQLGKRNYARQSSKFMYNGNYLAIRELTLSYNLPAFLLRPAKINRLEFSVTGQNLGYITAAKGVFSPEKSDNNGGYPLPKTVIFGLNLSF